MAVKLKDVAAEAGVANNTASSILNSRKDSWASEETKQRVRDAAEKLGYVPNRIARGLSLGKTNTIGLIIPDLQNPFYSALVTEIETEVIKRNYDLIIEDTRLDFHREKICLDKITSRQIDGLIINPINPCIFKTHLYPISKSGTSVVVLGEPPEASVLSCVQISLTEGVNATFQHLAEMGHRNVGFILHALAQHQKATPRIARFREALEKYNLKSPESFLIQCEPTLSSAHDAFKTVLKTHPKEDLPTAFVCLNDLLAIGAMRAASEAGLRIPADLSFVGVDNIPIAEFMPVALTTIAQPIRQMAIDAVATVLDEKVADGSKSLLSGKLIIRESTGAAAAR